MRALRGGELVCLYVTDAASESKKREGTRPGSQWMLFRRKLNRVLSLPLLRNLIVILILLDLFSIALVCHVGSAAELKRSHRTPSECHSRNCCVLLVTLIQASNPTVQTTIRDNLFVLQYITTMAILLECLLEVRCGTVFFSEPLALVFSNADAFTAVHRREKPVAILFHLLSWLASVGLQL